MKADRRRFAVAMGKLMAVYRVPPDDVLVESYWEALASWPIEALEAGARSIIREAKFFPRPVEWSDAAEDFLRERAREDQQRRPRLAQSTRPPLRADEVKSLLAELTSKLSLPKKGA